MFEKYRGSLLPPNDALEAEMVNLGVAPNQKDRARQVFLRSAEQAGYFQSGKDRLVPPSFSLADKLVTPDPKPDTGGSEKKSLRDHPLIQGLFQMLPEEGPWPSEEREDWVAAAKVNFQLVYGKSSSLSPSGPQQPSSQSESDLQGSAGQLD